MGRGDNRRSLLARRRKAWRRKKFRLKAKVDAAKSSKAGAQKKK